MPRTDLCFTLGHRFDPKVFQKTQLTHVTDSGYLSYKMLNQSPFYGSYRFIMINKPAMSIEICYLVFRGYESYRQQYLMFNATENFLRTQAVSQNCVSTFFLFAFHHILSHATNKLEIMLQKAA